MILFVQIEVVNRVLEAGSFNQLRKNKPLMSLQLFDLFAPKTYSGRYKLITQKDPISYRNLRYLCFSPSVDLIFKSRLYIMSIYYLFFTEKTHHINPEKKIQQ